MEKALNSIFLKSWDSGVNYEINPNTQSCNCSRFLSVGHCKHVWEIGYSKEKYWKCSTHPTFSQALSGFVKSIRLRNIREMVYWMVYLDQPALSINGGRFRLARRILIDSCEDGLSASVINEVQSKFSKLCRADTSLIYLVAEALRIAKTKNWWVQETGGHGYVYSTLVALRKYMYTKETNKLTSDQHKTAMLKALKVNDTISYFYHLIFLENLVPKLEVYEFVKSIAQKLGKEDALLIIQTHINHAKSLTHDNNFIWMASYCLFEDDVMSTVFSEAFIKPEVSVGEVKDLIIQAQDDWKYPHLIPQWCCDGAHCAGWDRRFAGMLSNMYSACLAYNHYGDLKPEYEWLDSFYCLDGLVIEDNL